MYGLEDVEPCPYCSESLVEQTAGVQHEYEDKNCIWYSTVYGEDDA